jgi:uncharacterized membrane protein
MSTKHKILNAISAHPKLVTFGIGLAVTMAIGTAIGLVDNNLAFAGSSIATAGGGST